MAVFRPGIVSASAINRQFSLRFPSNHIATLAREIHRNKTWSLWDSICCWTKKVPEHIPSAFSSQFFSLSSENWAQFNISFALRFNDNILMTVLGVGRKKTGKKVRERAPSVFFSCFFFSIFFRFFFVVSPFSNRSVARNVPSLVGHSGCVWCF